MKFFDLFCGIGGFRLGMEANANVCIGSCEIDKYARQTYAKNFGHEPEYRDVREIKPRELPDFDCLCAGFPCQSFSLAGKRRGFEDTRGTLFFEITRIAREKQPSVLLLENVKGLVSHDKGETFRIILETLDELGYDVEWQIINSKNFVPQNRERIFIIGHLRGSGRRKILPIGEGSDFDDQSCKETQTERKRIRMPYIRTIDANYWKGGSHGSMIAEPKKITMIALTERRTEKAKEIRRETRKASGRDFVPRREKELVERNDGLANCITAGQSMERFLTDGFRVRKLTPTECERLQGFPDGWTKGVSDTQRYKQLGNAVTATVVEYIAQYLDE
tara:strand:+ start:1341 stop:2342 length:1002 start_codon:yes stop_codon:yes gene_type:complete